MKEYTLLVIISSIVVIILDFALKTKILAGKIFYIFWSIALVLMLIVNGYLTYRPIVIYNDGMNLGVRLFSIPVEDFLFGFSLILLNLIIWEYTGKRIKNNE